MRRTSLLMTAVALLAGLAWIVPATASAQPEAGVTAARTVLYQWWNGARADNFLSGTTAGDNSAYDAGYTGIRMEAFAWNADLGTSTRPLYTYWNNARGDNIAAAHPTSIASAVNAGYTFIRTEGYVYSQYMIGTIPLQLYWNGARGDNITVASQAGINSARAAGYTFIRTEGWVFPIA
jgi:hypothetical protein